MLDTCRQVEPSPNLAETLILEDDIDDSSSLDNNCSHSSGRTSSESGESGLSEDEDSEEHDNRELVTTQTARSSQKMAFEVRISQHRVLISQLMVT